MKVDFTIQAQRQLKKTKHKNSDVEALIFGQQGLGTSMTEVPGCQIHPSLSRLSGPAGVKEIAHSELESNETMLGQHMMDLWRALVGCAQNESPKDLEAGAAHRLYKYIGAICIF